jgi:hypothetical protein
MVVEQVARKLPPCQGALIGLDEVRAKVHTSLRYDGGKFAGLGQEGDQRHLQKILLGR